MTSKLSFRTVAWAVCSEIIPARTPGSQATPLPEASNSAEVVFLLHGIGKSRIDMAPMGTILKQEGFEVVNWTYPSRQHPVESLADMLEHELKAYSDRTVHFVTHSMGGIVVRNYLSRYRPANVGRFIMIGTPNQGAYLADVLSPFRLYGAMFGPAGAQLCTGERGACVSAGVPECEFGIIAGGIGWKLGMNPLVPGDNDFTVSVESTRLEGARDFAVLPYPHPVIQFMPKTIEYTLSFLRSGQFLSC